jgi:proline dehydrogenase
MGLDRAILFGLATNSVWERLVRALPVGEEWARRTAARYVAGDTAAEALELARNLDERGVLTSVDFFGSWCRTTPRQTAWSRNTCG